MVRAAIGCGLISAAIVPANAATIVLDASQDTTLFQSGVNNSAGGQLQFYSGGNTAMSPRRALIEFEVEGPIPPGALIRSVDLTLTLSMVAGSGMGGGSGTPTIGLHQIASAWGEGSVSSGMGMGATAGPGDATWSSSSNGSQLWTTPGGDFDLIPSASLTIVGTKVGVPYTWASNPALVADVQQWLDAPATNHGWLLRNTDETGVQTFRAFFSRDSDDPPSLAISYAIAGDASFDDVVDGADYTLWADHYLMTGQMWEHGDFNHDGTVDGADYTIWADHYAPGPALAFAIVPEPSTITQLATGVLVCLVFGLRHRRAF